MLRRLRKTTDYDLTLEVKNDAFIRPPHDHQRNWLLNKALADLAADLAALDREAAYFMPGGERVDLTQDRMHAELSDDDIMEDWQIPIMRAMAESVASPQRDLLEIGFGRGVSSEFIQAAGVKSHTIVECNERVVERYTAWRARRPEHDIRLIFGKWQDTLDQFGQYDAIFFHTYALSEDEYLETAVKGATFAEHFFDTAAAYLRPGGVFTYLTNEIDSLSREHQRSLLSRFRSVELSKVAPLSMPADLHDTWYARSMMIAVARK